MDIVEFLRARIDKDKRTAEGAGHELAPARGEHWRWEDSDTDEVVSLLSVDPDDYLGSCGQVSLRSREEYPTPTVGPLPHFAVDSTDVQKAGPARHIARWDPARVLAEVASKRALLEFWDRCDLLGIEAGQVGRRAMALTYREHEDYQPEWELTVAHLGDNVVDSLRKLSEAID